MKEIKSLTGLRGLAALYVALFHSLELKGYNGSHLGQKFINHGFLAVDIFFLLSGFVMAYSSGRLFDNFSWKNYASFMRKRFARIYPMYFLVMTFVFVFLNHFYGKSNYLIGLTLLSILFAHGYVVLHLWSISTEWVAYLVFPILYKVGRFKEAAIWNLFLIVLCFTLLLIFYFSPQVLLLPERTKSDIFTVPPYPTLFKCFVEYILGIVAYNLYRNSPSSTFSTRILLGLNSSLLLLSFCWAGLDFFSIILSFTFIYLVAKDNGPVAWALSSKAVYFLGNISYSLYLLHPIFLIVFKDKFYFMFGSALENVILFNLLYTVALVTVSYFTYKYIELPMQALLRNSPKPAVTGVAA